MVDQAQLDMNCRVSDWRVAMRPMPDDSEAYAVVVRSDLAVSPDGELEVVEAADIPLCDTWTEEGGVSVPEHIGELLSFKEGREIYCQGIAGVGTFGLAVETVDGQTLEKSLTVTAEQRWTKGLLLRKPAPAVDSAGHAELSWRESFGGTCPVTGQAHPLNPAGRGYRLRGQPEVGERLPRLYPLEGSWRGPFQTPEVDSLLPLPEAWRHQWMGSGEAATTIPDQRLAGQWQAGDCVTIRNTAVSASPDGIRCTLPDFRPRAVLAGGAGTCQVEGRWDTVIVHSSEHRLTLSLLWRGSFKRIQPHRPEWLCVDS